MVITAQKSVCEPKPADTITVLTSQPNIVLTKSYTITPEGEWETEPYNSAKTFWRHDVPINSFDDLLRAAYDALPNYRQCWIRGAANPGLPFEKINRRNENFSPTDHQWVMFDLDLLLSQLELLEGERWEHVKSLVFPLQNWNDPSWCDEVAHALWLAAMPEAHHESSVIWSWSSSAGIKSDKLGIHFLVWLDRPVCDMSIKEWLRNPALFPHLPKPKANSPNLRGPLFDTQLYNPCQVHYTAAPIIRRGEEPLASRFGFYEGTTDLFLAPEELVDLTTWKEQQREAQEKKEREKAKQKKLNRQATPKQRRQRRQVTTTRYSDALDKLERFGGAPGTGTRTEMFSLTLSAASWAKGADLYEGEFLSDIESIWNRCGRKEGEGQAAALWAWGIAEPRYSKFREVESPEPQQTHENAPVFVEGAQLAVPPLEDIQSGDMGITVADKGCLPSPTSSFYNAAQTHKVIDLPESERYLPSVEIASSTKLLCLPASTGSGKNRAIIREIHRNDYQSALVLVPLVVLAESFYHRWERGVDLDEGQEPPELTYYADTSGKIDESFVVACVNSVHRIDKDKSYDVVVLDEVEQCIQSLTSPGLMRENMGRAYESLRGLLLQAKRVVLMDAYLTKETVTKFADIMGLKEDQIQWQRHEYIHPETKLQIYPERGQIFDKLMRDIWRGKRLFVTCTHKSTVKTFKEAILKRKPDLNILTLHSESPPEDRETLTNPNETWLAYDLVICSPTVGSGVSFDVPNHFDYVSLVADSVIGPFANGGIGWNNLKQSVVRVRNPNDRTIHTWVAPHHRSLETKEALRRREEERCEATLGITQRYHPESRTWKPNSPEHFDFFFHAKHLSAQRYQCAGGDFLAWYASRGVPGNYELFFNELARKEYAKKIARKKSQITNQDIAKMSQAELATIRKEQKQKEAEATEQAELITIQEAAALLDSPEGLEPEQRHSANKAVIQDFIQRRPSTEDCHAFLFGRRRTELKNMAHIGLMESGRQDVFEILDDSEARQGYIAQLQHHTLTAQGMHEIWKMVTAASPGLGRLLDRWGRGEDVSLNTVQQELEGEAGYLKAEVPNAATQIKQAIEENYALWEPARQKLGLPNPEKANNVGAQSYVGSVLRGFGIRTDCKELREGKKKKRIYSINSQSVYQAFRDATPCRRKMLDECSLREDFLPIQEGVPPLSKDKNPTWGGRQPQSIEKGGEPLNSSQQFLKPLSSPDMPLPSCDPLTQKERRPLERLSEMDKRDIVECYQSQAVHYDWKEICDYLVLCFDELCVDTFWSLVWKWEGKTTSYMRPIWSKTSKQ